MIPILACSLLLWFPGQALLCRLGAGAVDREAGLLGALARGYAASLLLLSPLSLACYALHAPLWVFSAGLALLVVGGVAACLRDRSCLRWSFERYEWCGVALLLLHLAMQVRVGAWIDGDATFHVGRMRWLMEHAFSNRDIYLGTEYFQHIYHSNLLYPLYASLAQLTGTSFLEAWFSVQPWAKLVSFAAHGYLAYVVSSRRWVGWAAALLAEAARSPETYTLYPNGVAGGFLLPLAIAVSLRAAAPDERRIQPALELGALSFLLGQVHGLYAVYAGLCAGGVIVLRMLLGGFGDRSTGRALLPCLLALAAALPFLLVTRYAFIPSNTAQAVDTEAALPELPPARAAASKPAAQTRTLTPALAAGGGNLEKQLEALPDGRYVMPIERMGGIVPLCVGFLALGLCLLLDRVRRRMWLALGLLAAALCVTLVTPALCTLAIRVLQESFAVARLTTVLASLLFTAAGAALGLLLERAPHADRLRAPALLVCAALGTQLLGHAPRSFEEHARAAWSGASESRTLLGLHEARRALLLAHVPAGSTVLTTTRQARYVAMVFDARVVAADRGHTYVPALSRLRREAELMTARRTEPALRAELLQRHRIRWVAYREKDRASHAWAEQLGRHLGKAGEMHLVDLGERFSR